jgi:hypothetical protein
MEVMVVAEMENVCCVADRNVVRLGTPDDANEGRYVRSSLRKEELLAALLRTLALVGLAGVLARAADEPV